MAERECPTSQDAEVRSRDHIGTELVTVIIVDYAVDQIRLRLQNHLNNYQHKYIYNYVPPGSKGKERETSTRTPRRGNVFLSVGSS